ncbi:MAG TPA: hypothetical protein VL285_15930 [Bryobacteraceae bacterium]|nr:hypothetical protein [Bryobacteraceae bacterium]
MLIGLAGFPGALSAQTNLNRSPSRSFGQPFLTADSTNPNLIEGREFYSPQSIAIDSTVTPPVLYVADSQNNRVLGWKNALVFSNGAKADFVIGQKDLYSTRRGGPGTAFTSGLRFPTGLAVDKNGNLYVVDTGNNRILRFPKPYLQTEQFPNMVIGQTGLSCGTCIQPNSGGISAKTIAVSNGNAVFTTSLIFDTPGNLWFTDSGNNRVLRYPAAALTDNSPNTPAADLVLGQLDFTTSTAPQINNESLQLKTNLLQPQGLAFDPSGRLYVSDSPPFNRVLVYQPNLSPQTFDNGRAALRIMGLVLPRPGTIAPPPVNEVQFLNPSGLFMLGNRPGVVDTGNSRLLLFDPFEQWPSDQSSPHAISTTGPIGQFGYTAGKPNRDLAEPRNNTFFFPSFAVATSTDLFVSDTGNNRVMVFPVNGLLQAGGAQNAVATRVLGQDDFVFRGPNLLEGREVNFSPGSGADGGLIIDFSSDVPHLYIADTYNNRVLGYRDARAIRPGDKADLVIGQPDFQRSLINYPSNDPDRPNEKGLSLPIGLALDSAGNLFVADAGNGRVLRFPKPFDQTQPNFPSADLVLGQTSFTGTKIIDPTPRTMRQPYGLAFTSDGGLLVSDAALNRVLFFPRTAQNFVSGMSATKIFGQPDFNSVLPGPESNQMNSPRHIATDSDDRLYVCDQANNRLMIFDNVIFSGSSNARAGTILTGPTPSGGFANIQGIFVSKITGEFWITELSASRVLRFPKFDDLPFQQNSFNYQITSNFSVAVAQDNFGDLFVAEGINRVAIYYPGLTAINAANGLKGRALAPGTIVTAQRQGSLFTDSTVTADMSNWPTELADTQLLVNDAPAPIRDVKPDELNFLMPMSAPPGGTVEVQVVRKSTGQILGAGPVDMAPASPALFTRNGFGTGQIVANNDDGSANEPSHPISRGKVISLFGTGLGYVPNAPPDGQAPGEPVKAQNPRVFMGSRFIEDADCKPDGCIVYSGLAPGQVGVWQIDVKVPDFVAPSSLVQVVVQLRSISSSQPPQITTIAVSQ